MSLDRKNNVKKYRFFESICSFRRPETIDQYNTYMDTGYDVIVSCPSSSYHILRELLNQRGRKGIQAVTIESMGISISSMPPKLLRREYASSGRPMVTTRIVWLILQVVAFACSILNDSQQLVPLLLTIRAGGPQPSRDGRLSEHKGTKVISLGS